MSKTETLVVIAEKLYSCRRSLRRLVGDYDAIIVDYMQAVRGYSLAQKTTEITACIRLAKELTDDGHEMGAMWVMAATIELIEPDDKTPVIA